MNRRIRSLLILSFCFLLLFSSITACSSKTEVSEESDSTAFVINSLNDLNGRKIGTLKGSDYETNIINQNFPDSEIVFYDNVYELMDALSEGNIDGFVADECSVIINNYPDLCLLTSFGTSYCASAFPKTESGLKLRDQFNEYLAKLEENDGLSRLSEIWHGSDESLKTVENLSSSGNKIIKLGVSTDIGAPYVYLKDNELTGYEVSLVTDFCREYGYGLEITNYSFKDLLAAIENGNIDIGSSCITITDARKDTMYFSDVTSSSTVQLVVRVEDTNVSIVEVLSNVSVDANISNRFADKKIGVMSGTVLVEVASKHLPDSELCFYNTSTEMAEALQNGEIDAYVEDESIAEYNITNYEGQFIVSILEDVDHAFIFQKTSKESEKLLHEMNSFLSDLKATGELNKIKEIWFDYEDDSKKVIDYSSLTGENGILTFSVCTDEGGPFVYKQNGMYLGYEMDLVVRFCKEYGYAIDVIDTNYSQMLASVEGGRCDFAGSAICITEDRLERFECSDANYNSSLAVVSKNRDKGDTLNVSDSSILESITGLKFGVLSGSIDDQLIDRNFKDCTYTYYNSVADLGVALDTDKIDAYCTDLPCANSLLKLYPDQMIYALLSLENIAAVFPKDSVRAGELRSQLNQYLSKIKHDGTFRELSNIWLGDDNSLKVIDYESLTGENGTINIAVSTSVGDPFCYISNDNYSGYDIDLIVRFCTEYGYDVSFDDYDFGGMLAAVSSGKADLGISGIIITDEREKKLVFSDPTYFSGSVMVTKDDFINHLPAEKSEFEKFIDSAVDSFKKTFIEEERWKLYLSGIGVTGLITVLSALFGTIFGFLIYPIYRKENRIIHGLVDFLINIFSKTPMIVILMVLYYIIFANSSLNGIIVSIVGFTITFTSNVIGMISVSERTIDIGQNEAALALGYTEASAYIRVILPQLRGQFLQLYKDALVSLIKDTAAVGYIAVQDLTKVSDIIRSRTFEAFFPLIVTAVIYFLFASLLAEFIGYLINISDPKRRSKKEIAKGVKKND